MRNLGTLDWIVIAAFTVSLILIGAHVFTGSPSEEE